MSKNIEHIARFKKCSLWMNEVLSYSLQNIMLDKYSGLKTGNNCYLSIASNLPFTCPMTSDMMLLVHSI